MPVYRYFTAWGPDCGRADIFDHDAAADRGNGAGAMLERIVYVSRAAPGTGLDTVFGIIRAAHLRNSQAEISGGLIFLDSTFVQVLEGSPEAVGRLHARLLRDPRHAGLDLRARERALCRLFRGQAMALRTRACLDPVLLDAFGYAPGFPVARFPADALLEFVVRACRGRAAPAAPAHPAPRRIAEPGRRA